MASNAEVEAKGGNWEMDALLTWGGGAVSVLMSITSPVIANESAPPDNAIRSAILAQEVHGYHGVTPQAIVQLDDLDPTRAATAIVPVADLILTLDLQPHSVRTSDYVLYVQERGGGLVEREPGDERTMRGVVSGLPGSTVAASALDDGLHALIALPNGERYWIQPVASVLPHAEPGDHFVYQHGDIDPVDVSCGFRTPERARRLDAVQNDMVVGLPEGSLCIAELACDADFEYFDDYGSVEAVEDRIASVMNTVNLQYEGQVGIQHVLSAVVVRSTPDDPYTSSDSTERLCEFITEWTNNQQGIQRDLAKLFTGKDLSGSVIGQAADLGNVCQDEGCCGCGQFGTDGSYCIVQSDFNGLFACATDLSAHELGHLWGAVHCNCPDYTMNPSIMCANQFTSQTIFDIISYRSTRPCLDGSCQTQAPPNDDCVDALPFMGGMGDGTQQYSTVGATTDGPENPPDICNDFGQTQTHHDIWFTYTATCTGTLLVTTCADLHGQAAPDYDTDLVVYGPYGDVADIDCGNLSFAACNDDDPDNPCGQQPFYSSTITIPVVQFEVYLIRVGGWADGSQGSGRLHIRCTGVTTGACCFTDGSCLDMKSSTCNDQGGTYLGDGTTCGANPCPQPFGACCQGVTCTIETRETCADIGGEFQGADTTCQPNPCTVAKGACCYDDGLCLFVPQITCDGTGGTYWGDGVGCDPNPCPQPTGACCFLIDGSCSEVTAEDCSLAGGLFLGETFTCDPNPCPQPEGACCVDGVTCSILSMTDCAAQGGDYAGDFTNCSTHPCPPAVGACCHSDGSCLDVTEDECVNAGGDYQGDFTSCVDGPCVIAVCGDVDAGDCFTPNGTPACDDLDCCLAVCAADPFCCETSWDQICADAAASICVTCVGDCGNGDGTADTADLLLLLAQWGGPGSCDIAPPGGNGVVDTADLLEMLSEWGPCE